MFLNLDQSKALKNHAEIVYDFFTRMKEVHGITMHEGQIDVAKQFFNNGKKIIMSQWGRSGAKTETVLIISNLQALLFPNSLIYIIVPERKQGSEIYWASGRLPYYAPDKYVAERKKSELRVEFKNGSFICVDGCENYNAHRGIKPTLVFYDEFQGHSKEFDLEVMRPNILAKKASLIVSGTPPKRHCYYVDFRKRLLDQVNDGDETRYYAEYPSWVNPSLDRDELEKTKQELFAAGDDALWYREYEGKLVFGGEGAVFPQWDSKKHIRDHGVIDGLIQMDKTKLKFVTAMDPGNATCFAVLFMAYNPYSSSLYILDEIYEKDRKLTDPIIMWKRIYEKEAELYGDPESTQILRSRGRQSPFKRVYDEAAAWFATTVSTHFATSLIPTQKRQRNIDEDVGIIKSLMAGEENLMVSNRCKWLPWEIENFVTDDQNRYPNQDDHLLDCFRYGLAAVRFSFIEKNKQQSQLINSDENVYTGKKHFVHQVDTRYEDWTDNALYDSLVAQDWEFYDA